MTFERFHRLAVLADVEPRILRAYLRREPIASTMALRIGRAIRWVREDDVRRGRSLEAP